jgi:hypothetical protein
MTLYKIINISPIQEHPYLTHNGGAEREFVNCSVFQVKLY